MAARHNTAIIGVSHLTKATGPQALLRVSGSLAFVAAARAAYLIAPDPKDPTRRLLLPMKNNLARDTGGLAFRIEPAVVKSTAGDLSTSLIAWESEVVLLTADEALQAGTGSKKISALSEAVDWLRDVLQDGPVPAAKLYELAAVDGIAQKTLQRASREIGVQKAKGSMEDGWYWSLPKMANLSEDGQENGLGTFGEVDHLRDSDDMAEVEI
jgi:hypothetical protein